MKIGSKILKALIIVFEGCVVKLKEIEACLDDKNEMRQVYSDSEERAQSSKYPNDEKKFSTENYFNISCLDQYVQSIDLPVGSSFMKIIQKTELKTEYNIIKAMLDSLSNDIKTFEVLYNNIKELKLMVFQYIQPSPLRKDETTVVDKNFVCEELNEDGLSYDDKKSLYDNSLRVLESKQKLVLMGVVKRFDPIIKDINDGVDDVQKKKVIQILEKELNDRNKIIEIKLKR